MTGAYPLLWPEGQPRVPAETRRRSAFKVSFGWALTQLLGELRRLGAKGVIVSTNVPLRLDGLPYADNREPKDPGVALYFDHGKRRMVIACDSYTDVRSNLRACGVTVEALRTIQRHGATELLERAFTGFAALPPKGGESRPWYDVLGVPPTTNLEGAKAAFRELARLHHPDAGGDPETMARLNRAFEQAEAALQ